MTAKKRIRTFVIALLSPLATAAASVAQTPPSAEGLPTPAGFFLAPTLADRAPYTAWKTHLGPASDALVTARVTIRDGKTGKVTEQKGTGLIVRCDGLVLLPAALLHTPENTDGRQPERVTEILLQTISAKGLSASQAFIASPPRFTARSAPFVLVKARDVHVRAAALLNPRNLSPDRAIEVIYPKAAESPSSSGTGSVPRFEAARVKAKTVQKDENTLGVTLDAAPAANLLPGAIVVDKASQMAIGILGPAENDPAHASATSFATFARLHDVTNAVALVPEPDDRLESTVVAARTPGMAKDGMVWIPGGPLAVRTTDYPEIQGALVACTPGFWIDRSEVTVADYRTFLTATKYRPLPSGWTEADLTANGPVRRDPNLPVRGVSPADAAAYAEWSGKRLATPLEWEWAARGAGLGPVKQDVSLPNAYALSQTDEEKAQEATPRLSHQSGGKVFIGRGNNVTIVQLGRAVAKRGVGWLSAYEQSVEALETELRITAAISGYIEAKYWAFWQDPRSPQTILGKRPEWASTPQFRSVAQYLTPTRAVSDSTYLSLIESDEGLNEWHPSYGAAHSRLTAAEDSITFMCEMFNPLPILPVGTRAYDRSVFGINDVAANIPEWLQANRAWRAQERAEKPLHPLFDPDQEPGWKSLLSSEVSRRLTQFNVALNGGDRFDFPRVQSKLAFIGGVDRMGKYAASPHAGGMLPDGREVIYPGERIDRQGTLGILSSFRMPLLPFFILTHPEDAPDLGTGFRCAR